MQITLSPMRRDDRLSLARSGDVLTINGVDFDFAAIPEGGTLPREEVASDWLASDVTRLGGVLQLVLILPHGAAAPPETLFPAPLTLTADGPVQLPPWESEQAE
ncbi:MAG: hypothetical protein CVT83_05940 [Alphaproteobacteria bacterium HGW-Alphaproteobacteria-5]|nr:MAG: hypothetical protein CVT83_05940 [Alphaproteobacteria bacterium HGW-Alphaproteobacteria-5]